MAEGGRLLTRKALRSEKGIAFSNKHLLHLEREGRFPRRIVLGERTVAWREAEVDAWIDARPVNPSRPTGARLTGEQCAELLALLQPVLPSHPALAQWIGASPIRSAAERIVA